MCPASSVTMEEVAVVNTVVGRLSIPVIKSFCVVGLKVIFAYLIIILFSSP